MKKQLSILIGTSGYVGLIKGAPGTYGSIIGCITYYLFVNYLNVDINILLIGLSVLFTIIGTYNCMVLEKDWGHDPSRIVIDETVGQWITFLFIPFSLTNI